MKACAQWNGGKSENQLNVMHIILESKLNSLIPVESSSLKWKKNRPLKCEEGQLKIAENES